MSKPYKYWDKEDLYRLLINQARDFRIDPEDVYKAVWDLEWNPIQEYNGCNCVQDDYHPFLPCFIHDYHWVVKGGGIEYDRIFRTNLMKAGFSKVRAYAYFYAVRAGWIFYYKWKK